MTAVILSFRKAVALRNHRLGVVENIVKNKASVNSYPDDSYFLHDLHLEFLDEYNVFIRNMQSRHTFTMYPSILTKYRRGINPVSAIYNEVQKILLLNSNDAYSKWVLSLFKDTVWFDKLICALELDIISIIKLMHKYKYCSKDNTYNTLMLLKTNLQMYRDVFISNA